MRAFGSSSKGKWSVVVREGKLTIVVRDALTCIEALDLVADIREQVSSVNDEKVVFSRNAQQ